MRDMLSKATINVRVHASIPGCLKLFAETSWKMQDTLDAKRLPLISWISRHRSTEKYKYSSGCRILDINRSRSSGGRAVYVA